MVATCLSIEHARRAMRACLNAYNTQWPHQALKYKIPDQNTTSSNARKQPEEQRLSKSQESTTRATNCGPLSERMKPGCVRPASVPAPRAPLWLIIIIYAASILEAVVNKISSRVSSQKENQNKQIIRKGYFFSDLRFRVGYNICCTDYYFFGIKY